MPVPAAVGEECDGTGGSGGKRGHGRMSLVLVAEARKSTDHGVGGRGGRRRREEIRRGRSR